MYVLYYSEAQDNRSIYGYIYTRYTSLSQIQITDLQSDTQCT